MAPPLYTFQNVAHYYNEHPALSVDGLTVAPGTITGLIGPNGSGKSTLLKLMAFTETPTQGVVLFNGQPALPFCPEVRFAVTLLMQEPYLMRRTVFDNVAYGLKIRRTTGNPAPAVNDALQRVGLDPAVFARRRWNELSGGEAQRVALAARLVLTPRVLLLDEPTASVDAASARLIRGASLRAREQWGTSLVIASHDWQWLYEVCDQVLHLFRGRISGEGMENILFGPWTRGEEGLWGRAIGHNQRLLVSPPPTADAVGLLPATAIRLETGTPDSGENWHTLSALVSRTILEKSSGDVVATLLVGEEALTVKVDYRWVMKKGLYPGRTVWLRYQPERIGWTEEP